MDMAATSDDETNSTPFPDFREWVRDQAIFRRNVDIVDYKIMHSCYPYGSTVSELEENERIPVQSRRAIWNHIKKLRDYGLLIVEPYKRNKSKIYRANWVEGKNLLDQIPEELANKLRTGYRLTDSEKVGLMSTLKPELAVALANANFSVKLNHVTVEYLDKHLTVYRLWKLFHDPQSLLQNTIFVIDRALAHLKYRSQLSDIHLEEWPTPPSRSQLRLYLFSIRPFLEQTLKALDELLNEDLLWSDKTSQEEHQQLLGEWFDTKDVKMTIEDLREYRQDFSGAWMQGIIGPSGLNEKQLKARMDYLMGNNIVEDEK